MKFAKVLIALCLLMGVCSAFTTEDKGKGLYMVGVSASFTDSLIYFTDVQFVDSIEIGKDGLLHERGQYSTQLDDYLKYKKGLDNRTTFIYFHKNKAKLEKDINKMKGKYRKEGKALLKQVDAGFKFQKATTY